MGISAKLNAGLTLALVGCQKFRWYSAGFAGFALARYKIPLALVLHYKISADAGAGANADQRTSGAAQVCLQQLQIVSEVQRVGIKRRQPKLHNRILKASATKIYFANVGNTVIIPIAKPDVLIPLGSKNMMGVIMEKEDNLYAIGTDQGKLESKYTRNQCDVCQTMFQKIDSVPESIVSQTTYINAKTLLCLSRNLVIASTVQIQDACVGELKLGVIQDVIMGCL